MRGLGLLFLICSCWTAAGHTAECDEFVSLVATAKTSYQKEHRIYPVSDAINALAQRYMPRLWVHPQSWHPISFEDYLDRSRLIRKSDGQVLRVRPSIHFLSALDFANQCATYLKSEEIKLQTPAPVYIQIFWDQNPAIATEKWTYIKLIVFWVCTPVVMAPPDITTTHPRLIYHWSISQLWDIGRREIWSCSKKLPPSSMIYGTQTGGRLFK
jgi:hypothetical protein